VFLGELGTSNANDSFFTTGAGSQGQWFTDLVNFIRHSRTGESANDPGFVLGELGVAYWALNGNDDYALLNKDFDALENPDKLYVFLCAIQANPAPGCQQGALPAPDSTSPPVASCTSDGPCDDQDACNGVETCNLATGACLPGTPVSCSDGDACNGIESCDPPTGACSAGAPPVCNDGMVCNGIETCDPAVGCVSGSPVVCDDADPCTEDVCLEPGGTCGTTGANLCPTCGSNRAPCSSGVDCCSGQCKNGLCRGG
jgi:hypothetical protein